MGYFSWIDCRNHRRNIRINGHKDVYLLIPKEFGGGHIHETNYGGYGEFGGQDVYDLVVDWNKECIPEIIQLAKEGKWRCKLSKNEIISMECFYYGEPVPDYITEWWCREKRCIGVSMAAYDEDNVRLKYPIKITHSSRAVYEDCNPSPRDPEQGVWKS